MSATTRRTALTALAGAAAPASTVTAIASAYGALGMPGPPQHGGQPVTNIRNGVEPALARMARQTKPLHSASSRPPPSSRPSYVYVWADGVYLQARLEDEAQCILVIIGATPEGKKELLGLIDGARESAHDWRALLLDLKRRGLSMAPKVAVADGALGFWKAIGEVWPETREQRCWVHKTANILNKLPKSQQPKAKRSDLQSRTAAA